GDRPAATIGFFEGVDFAFQIIKAGEGAIGQRAINKVVGTGEAHIGNLVVGGAEGSGAHDGTLGFEFAGRMGNHRVDGKVVTVPTAVDDVVIGGVVGLILCFAVFQCGIALAVGKAGDQIGADAVIHTHGEMVGFQIVADFKSGLVLVAIDLGTVNKHAEAAGLFAGSATDVAIQAIDGSGICAVVSAGLATATQVMADIADLVGTQLNQ